MISSRFLHIACCSWYARKNSVSAEHVKSVVVQWWFGQFTFMKNNLHFFFTALKTWQEILCSFVPSISVRIFVWLSDGFLPCCRCWRPSHVFATVFALSNVLVWHVSWAFEIVYGLFECLPSIYPLRFSLYILTYYTNVLHVGYHNIWLCTKFGSCIRTTFCWPIFFRSRWSNLLFAVKDIAATASGTNMKNGETIWIMNIQYFVAAVSWLPILASGDLRWCDSRRTTRLPQEAHFAAPDRNNRNKNEIDRLEVLNILALMLWVRPQFAGMICMAGFPPNEPCSRAWRRNDASWPLQCTLCVHFTKKFVKSFACSIDAGLWLDFFGAFFCTSHLLEIAKWVYLPQSGSACSHRSYSTLFVRFRFLPGPEMLRHYILPTKFA